MKIKLKYIVLSLAFSTILTSCSEEDINPRLDNGKEIKNPSLVINNEGELATTVRGAYNRMSLSTYYGRDFLVLGDIFSDNVYSNANSNRFVVEGQMDLNSESAIPNDLWENIYATIASANLVIGLDKSKISGNEGNIDHLIGQAYIIRALAHFDILKFYGQQNVDGQMTIGIPYRTNFGDNTSPARSSVEEVKNFIYDDLDTAKSLMLEDYDSSTRETLNSYAVDAVLARVSNYFGDWEISLDAAESVLSSTPTSIATAETFVETFAQKNSVNSIFEIGNRSNDNQGISGLANIYQNTNYGDIVVLEDLVNTYEEEDVRGLSGDVEESIITLDSDNNYRNTGKYPSIAPYDDNLSLIRHEEIVLIYAEALFESDRTGEALTQLNLIPSNRNATPYTSISKENIILERRKELAFEGFRFHDLARTKQDIPLVDGVLQTHDGPEYGSYNYALPIPNAEITANGNITQNKGY